VYPAPEAWPARDIEVARQLLAKTPTELMGDVLIEVSAGSDTSSDRTMPRTILELVRPSGIKVAYAGLHGQGLLRLLEWPSFHGDLAMTRRHEERRKALRASIGFEPNGRIITSRTLQDPFTKLRRKEQGAAIAFAADVLDITNSTMTVVTRTHDAALDDGVPIRIPDRAEVAAVLQPRGLILHLQSLASNPFEPRVLKEFTRRGWIVIDISTQSQVFPPLTPEQSVRLALIESLAVEIDNFSRKELAQVKDALRTLGEDQVNRKVLSGRMADAMEMINRRQKKMAKLGPELDSILRNRAFQAGPNDTPEQIDATAMAIAHQVDNSLAGNAYALEAVMDYVHTQREDLRDLPRAVVAFSAGALTAPTGIARVRERFPLDAVVLIGGGADMFLLSQESSLTDGGVRIRNGQVRASPRPPRKVREALHEAYLRHTRLDPLKTASALAGLPVLQVHARYDSWVPEEGGELLWEQLGKPERWDVHLGHLGMFFVLPGKAGKIADWLDHHVPAPKIALPVGLDTPIHLPDRQISMAAHGVWRPDQGCGMWELQESKQTRTNQPRSPRESALTRLCPGPAQPSLTPPPPPPPPPPTTLGVVPYVHDHITLCSLRLPLAGVVACSRRAGAGKRNLQLHAAAAGAPRTARGRLCRRPQQHPDQPSDPDRGL